LDIGTGFHRELTGIENVYMNGAILGMKRREVTRKLDEIIGFSEIDTRHINTPVKRYSSGMYVRLGFSIAVHLESEIIISDEVLAVGDMAFRDKAIAKMNSLAKEGRTILFVSHFPQMVMQLCNKGIILEHGKMKSGLSPLEQTIAEYQKVIVAAS
jgi:lipopolysaccharide transport system ATP-binding protein